MRDRGKAELEAYNNGEFYNETMPGFPCTKHPTSSSSSSSSNGGICAYCLTDRLYQLVCPQCGEQRLPSCSCSETVFASEQNFPTTNDVSNVARISFLLENDKKDGSDQILYPKVNKLNDLPPLRRSNSTCVDINRGRSSETRSSNNNGAFSKLGKLFRKKRDKKSYNNNSSSNNNNNNNNDENKSEMGLTECVGVSRSRSLCSFRGFYDNEESGGFPVSSSSAARASNVSGNFMLDSAKRSCFSESEARMSNFEYDTNRNIFSVKESEFMNCVDDPAFIDLKLHDMVSDSRHHNNELPPLPALRRGGFGMSSTREFGYRGDDQSCRISVSERELRKCKKSYKVWKWFFRHQTSSRGKDDDHGFNS